MDNVSELMEKHPMLAALIKLEISNSLLRLQLGEDPTTCLQSRLDEALSVNSSLVLKVAEKNPASITKKEQSESEADHDHEQADGDNGVMGKVKNIIKRRRSRTSSAASGDADFTAIPSAGAAAVTAIPSITQSPVPISNIVGSSVPRNQKRVVSVRRPSNDSMTPIVGGSLAPNGQFATPVRTVEETSAVDDSSATTAPDGFVVTGSENSSSSNAIPAVLANTSGETVFTGGVNAFSPPADANYLEMCEVGVDRSILSGSKPAVSLLQRGQVVNKFPCQASETLASGACIDSSVVSNITEFCFPRGVPLDIVSATAADYIAGPQFDTYHVMQFSDTDGNKSYGCCIIITEKIRPSSVLVEQQLLDLQRMKKASNVICTRMKEYIRHKEHMRWAVKPAGIDKNIGNNAQRRRASMGSIATNTATASDYGDTASTSSDMTSPEPGNPGYKRSVFSKFFNRKEAPTPAETPHASKADLSTPGPVGAMYPYGETPSGEFVSPHGPPSASAGSGVGGSDKAILKSAFKTPGRQQTDGGYSNISMTSPPTSSTTLSPAAPAVPPTTATKPPIANQTPAKTPAKKRFSWFGGPSVPATPAVEAEPSLAAALPSLLEEMLGDTGSGPISPPVAPPLSMTSTNMSPQSNESSRCNSVSEAESESGDDGFIAEDGRSHDEDTSKLNKQALGAMYNLNLGRRRNKGKDKEKDGDSSDSDSDSSSSDSASNDNEGSKKDKGGLSATSSKKPLPSASSAVEVTAHSSDGLGTPENKCSPLNPDSALPSKPAVRRGSEKRLSMTHAGVKALHHVHPATSARESMNIDADDVLKPLGDDPAAVTPARKGRGRMIVTKKAFCILSRNPNHAFLFKVLQKIIDTETRSPACHLLSSIGGTSAGDEAEYSLAVSSILSDIKMSDAPITSDVTIADAIGNMTVNNRNKFLMHAMCCDLSGVIECHNSNARSTLGFENQNLCNSHPGQRERLNSVSHINSYGPDGARLLREHSRSIDELPAEKKTVAIECRSYFNQSLVISESFSSFKEWSCAILFATISHTLIIKIMNLLLLEKSILIYGTDVGIVSAIASALIEIVSPFAWEGVFVPVMPYIAKEVLQAPVPFIIGSTSLPKMEDLSPNAAIIFLDAKLGCRDIPIEECAWFMSIPEVDANMPVGDSLSKLLKYANQRLSKYLPLYKDRLEKWSANTTFSVPRESSALSSTNVIKIEELAVKTPPSSSTRVASFSRPLSPVDAACTATATVTPIPARSAQSPTPACRRRSPADLQKTFLYDLTDDSKIIIHKVLDAIARHNVAFCGDAAHTGGWIRYCKYNKNSGMEEFYPSWFMQPRRATTEFQEALVQTQLFVSYLDKLRIVYEKNTWQRDVISDWLYERILIRKAREELVVRRAALVEAEAAKVAQALADEAEAKAVALEIAKKVKEAEARAEAAAAEKARKAAEKAAREEAEKNTYWAKVAAAKEKTIKAKAELEGKAAAGSSKTEIGAISAAVKAKAEADAKKAAAAKAKPETDAKAASKSSAAKTTQDTSTESKNEAATLLSAPKSAVVSEPSAKT